MELGNHEKETNNQKDQNENINKILPIINKKENNLEIILMEKDKEIIKLSEKNSQLNLNLENISNELKNKNMEISTLKSDIQSLNNEKKLYEEEIQKYQEEISKLNNTINEKDRKIEEFNSSNDLINKKYMDLLEEQKNETNKLAENSLKLQKEINELNTKLVRKNRDITNLENIICKNREKDNQLFILKKDLNEKENLIKEFQNKLIIANNDLQTSKNFNEERLKQIYIHNINDKDNEIISFVVNKIQNLILFIDTDKNFDSNKENINENMVEIKEDCILYDLLDQNISILKNKIFNKYNSILRQNKEMNSKCRLQKIKNEELLKTLNQIKNNHNETIGILSKKFNQMQNNSQNKEDEIKKLNRKISDLSNYTFESIPKDIFNNFYSNIISKLDKEYLSEFNLDENFLEQDTQTKMNNILNIIDLLFEKIKSLNHFVEEYDAYKIKVNEIINKKMNLSNEQNDEIKDLKNNIQELNILLSQSNNYLNKTRKENSLLKNRILKLENSINMISKNNLIKNNNNDSGYLLTYNNDNNRKGNPFLED
jgi:chromosome segregation ATPase